jgi:hypothetical protein
VLYALAEAASLWSAPLRTHVDIDLPAGALPGYVLACLVRMTAAQHQGDALLEQLQPCFSQPEARRQLDPAIDWGRYAELFAYDDDTGELYLEQ